MSNVATIQCLYSCDVCGIRKQPVNVPERGPDEDVKHWIEVTAIDAIQKDHLFRTLGCPATKLAELYIPIPKGTDRVGEVVRS